MMVDVDVSVLPPTVTFVCANARLQVIRKHTKDKTFVLIVVVFDSIFKQSILFFVCSF